MFAKTIFGLCILTLAVSCESLVYVPVKTPQQTEKERKAKVSEQLKSDFSKVGKTYSSIAFGPTVLLKSPSRYKLDSLYAIKYRLEQRNVVDKKLEQEIKAQQWLIEQDTVPNYYLEKHVFNLSDSSSNETYFADVFVTTQEKVETIDIRSVEKIPSRDADLYASYVLRQSILQSNYPADEAEMAFYELYSSHLEQLSGSERENFLNFTLSIMRIARRYSSLDKSVLIKEQVRQAIQGNTRNMLDEKFYAMEEFFNDKNELVYYFIDYETGLKTEKNETEIKRFEVFLDPYLQLIELKPKL